MKVYNYVAFTKEGKQEKGQINAQNKWDAQTKLQAQEKIVLKLKPTFFLMNHFNSQATQKPKKMDIINFTRQLHTLTSAGISILEALAMILALNKNKNFSKIISQMIDHVKTGELLSQSLKPFSKWFGQEYIALVQVGEQSGNLDKVLEDLFNLLNWDMKLKDKLKGALRYPIIVITVALSALISMFIFVIPKFEQIYSKSKKELPLPTKILIKCSNFFSHYSLIIVFIIVLSLIILVIAYKKPKYKMKLDKIIFKIPVLEEIYKKYLVIRFCKIFPLLYKSGLAIIPSLKICQEMNTNAVYQADLEKLVFSLQRGVSLGEACQETFFFNGIVSQMVTIGEKSSKLDTMLEKVSDIYLEDINYILDNIFAYIEPLFILIMGLLVLGLALGILLPVWNMASAFT